MRATTSFRSPLLWAGVICLRLVYLQIFRYGDFEARAQHQQQRTTDYFSIQGMQDKIIKDNVHKFATGTQH